jgi:two-component system OmpR family sensor kinase
MSAPPLRRLLVYASVGVTSASVGLFTGALLLYFHHQIHVQTDALLLEMAHLEEQSLLREHDQPVHLHDTEVALHAVHGHVTAKYAMILEPRACTLLARTSNVSASTPLSALCELGPPGSWRHLNLEGAAAPLLRGVALSSRDVEGRALVFFVGIEHDQIDRSVWSTSWVALALGALLLLAVSVVARWLARRLTADLDALEAACRQLDVQALGAADSPQVDLTVGRGAPRELVVLSETLSALLRRAGAAAAAQRRFLAEAAHELRTPVTALRGELEVTLRRPRSPEEYREALEVALQQALRLGLLSEHLLDVMRAQSEPPRLEQVELGALAQEGLDRISGQARERGVALRLEASAPCHAWADPLATSRALDNLLRNALQHAQPSQITLRVLTQGDAAELQVEDDGPGLQGDALESLFEPFARQERRAGSFGLGLYLSRELMRRQGGDLRYLSEGGQGARWRLRLPLAGRQRSAAAPPAPAGPSGLA